jgi:hypothetical protein
MRVCRFVDVLVLVLLLLSVFVLPSFGELQPALGRRHGGAVAAAGSAQARVLGERDSVSDTTSASTPLSTATNSSPIATHAVFDDCYAGTFHLHLRLARLRNLTRVVFSFFSFLSFSPSGANSYYLFSLKPADRDDVLDALQSAGMRIVRIFITAVMADNKGSGNPAINDRASPPILRRNMAPKSLNLSCPPQSSPTRWGNTTIRS